jgi:hypothetical protein
MWLGGIEDQSLPCPEIGALVQGGAPGKFNDFFVTHITKVYGRYV